MGSLNQTTIRDQLYEELKQRIITRVYRAGSRLNIDRLARELRVSNTPLREALTRLESDGLVVTRPNRGLRVAELDAQSIMELAQTMYALLLGTYQLCRDQNAEPALVENLENRLRRQCSLFAQEDGRAFLQAGLAFDRCFVEATGNRRLLALYDQQSALFFLMAVKRAQPSPSQERKKREENLRQHQALLTAVINRDQEALRGILARHYRQSALPGLAGPNEERS